MPMGIIHKSIRRIQVRKLKSDPRLQHRVAGLNTDHVERISERLTDDQAFDTPPISVVSDGEALHMWDGAHRLAAYKMAGRAEIPAHVTEGLWHDALRLSLGANDSHGLGRSKADVDEVIRVALADPQLSKLSDRELAKVCGVSHMKINRMRRNSSVTPVTDAPESRTVTRNGKTYEMQTGAIGRKPSPQPEAPAVEEVTPKQPKPGKPVFDDRVIEEEIGKLVRLLDARANAIGKSKQHTDCLDALDRLDPDRKGVSLNKVRDLARLSGPKMTRCVDRLVTQRVIEETTIVVSIGSKASRAVQGLRRVTHDHSDQSDQSDNQSDQEASPNADHTIRNGVPL